MLAFVVALSAFVCPPIEEAVPPRQVGEQCGGTCKSFGECAPGLTCNVEKTTSPLSFAILMGPTAKAGKCRPVAVPYEEASVEERRQLQFGGVAGGVSDASLDSPELLAAAKFGVKMMMERSNSLTPATLSRVISAQQQVVAGIKYTIVLAMSDGSQHRLQILDQAWMTPRYTMMSDDIL